jgi:outer membrane lipoprotein-sorting protein
MDKKIIAKITIALLWMVTSCWASEGGKNCEDPNSPKIQEPQKVEPNSVDAVLQQLNKKASEIKSYEGQIEYKYIQPLLESEALRKGVLYYAKLEGKSVLRINFETLKQEDEEEQKYIEHYIFDGTWLTQINYQIKAVKRYELAEPNKPIDAFDVASRNLPILGFTKIEDLKKQFEIKLVEQEKDRPKDSNLIGLHLKVRPDSIYKDDYIWLDFWIDKKLGLPAKVIALSTEEDIYEIKLPKPKVNKGIDKKVFEFKIPDGFGEPEIVPLKKKTIPPAKTQQ